MSPALIAALVALGGVGSVIRYLIHTVAGNPRPMRTSAPEGEGPALLPSGDELPRTASGRLARRLGLWWGIADVRLGVVNIIASFIAGFAAAALDPEWRGVAVVGFCGGLSTWSTLMNDTRRHIEAQRYLRAVSCIVLTLAIAVVAAAIGLRLGAFLSE